MSTGSKKTTSQSTLTAFVKSPATDKKRKLEEVVTETADTGIKSASKKRVLNKDAKGAAEENLEEEKKQHASTEAESVEGKSKPAASLSLALTGDCLASYDSFIAELGNWQDPLGDYLKRPAFRQTFEFVKQEYKTQTIFPPKELIFNAFKHVPFDKLKVVLVGQDPYIKDGEAMGLCFSIPKTVKCPPSLKNIYKALENDPKVEFKTPNPIHGDLTKWADQGVLLLNAILTVRKGVSNSHQKKGWEQFTDHVISVIGQRTEGVVFLLWGSKAHEKAANVNASKHLILKGVHPSPLAGTGFTSCTHFSECNEYLIKKGKSPIDWNV